MARFERIQLAAAAWEEAWSSFPDRIVFQSPAWIAFLAETLRAEPVLAALKEGNETLGYFTGLIVRKFGMKILGSPFRGWSTPYLGFNLRPGVSRRLAAEALPDLAFRQLGCIHFEITDAHMTDSDLQGLGFTQVTHPTLEIDLTQSETALFNNLTKSCRWTVRKAEKNGVVIEEAQDAQFAAEFSDQLADVFAKQGLVSPFGATRVEAMMRHVHPTGRLLLLRARDPQGHSIATGIFPAVNRTAFYLGGASWRQYQKLYPNELLQWHAMRHWKNRGIATYNLVGNKDFKQKFGGHETSVPMFYQSKYRWLGRLRASAVPLGLAVLRLGWRLKGAARSQPEQSEPGKE
jgi:hypothetical protein